MTKCSSGLGVRLVNQCSLLVCRSIGNHAVVHLVSYPDTPSTLQVVRFFPPWRVPGFKTIVHCVGKAWERMLGMHDFQFRFISSGVATPGHIPGPVPTLNSLVLG